MQTRQEVITIAGKAIDVLSGGSGPAVVVLHRDTGRYGWTGLHAALAEKFTVIAPALPGYDGSERPEWLRNVTDLAGLVGLLMDKLSPGPTAILGLGYGGWVAGEIAAHSPGRVARLIVQSPMGVQPEQGEIYDQFLIDAEEYIALGFASEDSYKASVAIYGEQRLELLDTNREMTTRIAWKPAMYDQGLRHLLRGIEVPTLSIWATQDRIVPRSCAEIYRDAIAGARYAELHGVGHYADLEAPDALAKLVTDFLATTGYASRG